MEEKDRAVIIDVDDENKFLVAIIPFEKLFYNKNIDVEKLAEFLNDLADIIDLADDEEIITNMDIERYLDESEGIIHQSIIKESIH